MVTPEVRKEYEIVKEFFGENCWLVSESNIIVIKSCAVGDNFYDYGEEEPEEFDTSELPEGMEWILNSPNITFLPCEDCCCCAGW